MKYLVSTLVILFVVTLPQFNFAQVQLMQTSLLDVAKKSLDTNIVTVNGTRYLRAGANQFGSLWTRDFCFSTKGLLSVGYDDVVQNQLQLLIDKREIKSSLIARGLDSVAPTKRVLYFTLHGHQTEIPEKLQLKEPLLPEYYGEHKTPAFDSNILVLWASLNYVEHTRDIKWLKKNESALLEIYNFYGPFIKDGLVFQKAYSDWQDSQTREGATFYLNLMYYITSYRLEKLGLITNLDHIKQAQIIRNTFLDKATGLFKSQMNSSQITLDGQLLALDLLPETDPLISDLNLYHNLKNHPLWGNGLPGFNALTKNELAQISLTTRAVGLEHYHLKLRWSWLMAMSARVALKHGDTSTGHNILNTMSVWANRDHGIAEIYDFESPYRAKKTFLYESEKPFSWGAAQTLETLNQTY